MDNSPLNVAVIGCGRVAGHHCDSMQKVEGIRLAAVCDLVPERVDNYSARYGVPGFRNYHEMLRTMPQINLVAVITPSGMHSEHACDIMANYGKHVVVEKPTFMKLSQLRAAFELARQRGLTIIPVFQNRYNLAVQRVRQALRAGELGAIRIMAVRVRWCRPTRYYRLAPWRGTYAQDGGALTNQGVHHVDLLRYLGGEVERVTATMRTLGAEIEVEDAVVGHMTYASGAVGVLEVTTAARPDDFEASISIVGEKGLAQIGGVAVNELQVFTPDPNACAANSEDFSGNVYGNGHGKLYRDIAAHFQGRENGLVAEDDCRRSLALLHAFYRADERAEWVEVAADEESRRLGRPDETLANLYRSA